MKDDDMRETQPDDEDLSKLDPDALLVTRYLFRDLSPDEWTQFEARLNTDEHFYQKVWYDVQISRLPTSRSEWARVAMPPSGDGSPDDARHAEMRGAVEYVNYRRRRGRRSDDEREQTNGQTITTNKETMMIGHSFDPEAPVPKVDEARVRRLFLMFCNTIGRTPEGRRILPEKKYFRGGSHHLTR